MIGDGYFFVTDPRKWRSFWPFKIAAPLSLTLDLQGVHDPAYNQDRGPLGIIAGRMHLELQIARGFEFFRGLGLKTKSPRAFGA